MEIVSESDLKKISAIMHDSEFTDADFGFDPKEKKFYLHSRITQSGKQLRLEIFNVNKYNPKNLEKINAGKALGGVFNFIKTSGDCKKLIIVSQDLRIELRLTDLSGSFEEV